MSLNFLNKDIFKANDIRGKYPSEINEKVVLNIVSGIKNIFLKTVVVGYDARLSSLGLYSAVLSALKQSKDLKIIEAGMITTPAIYFLVNKLKADGGIIVTASHNPKEYNGLKIIGKKAVPMSGGNVLARVQSFSSTRFVRPATHSLVLAASPLVKNKERADLAESAAGVSVKRYEPSRKLYVKFLKKHLKVSQKIKIVFDCSNGTTSLVLRDLLRGNKKVEPIFINEKPDGNFPAHGPNPLADGALDQIKKEVVNRKADLGIIFDGDGDRVFFIDDLGELIDPDIVGLILTKKFKPPYVVSTINSLRVKKIKGTVVSKVGHLFMKEMMRKKKASLGMERSGHYYFKDFFYCDSGIFAAIQVMNFASSLKLTSLISHIRPIKISDFIKTLPKYYQIPETNFKMKDVKWAASKIVKAEKFYKNSAVVIKKEDGLLMEFKNWWLSLRISNSESLLRLNMEADNDKVLEGKLKEIKKLLMN